MTVSKIKIVRFPQKNGGAKWDETSGPDIYVSISLGSTIIHKQPTSFQDANSDLIYVYKPTTPFDLSDITSKYSISLFDNDSGSPDELMASIYFTPYLVSRGFPKFLYLDRGGDVAFLLTVEYEW